MARGLSGRWVAKGRGPAALAGFVVAVVMAAVPVQAGRGVQDFVATLGDTEREQFTAYYQAEAAYESRLDTYWETVNERRSGRKAKRSHGEALTDEDYVRWQPPIYKGPVLEADLAKRWEAFQAKQEETREPPQPRPGLADFLAHAKANYDFVPERIPEREFKLLYAREAVALGISKDQVVRIYALETSGLGTAEMVAGVHPITKKGSPISTAIGYSQLLAANSIDELAKSGPKFVDRLKQLARAPGVSPERSQVLAGKIESLKRMYTAARSVPDAWESHIALARTPKGLGIHAINLDADIGPWLQVIKLRGLKETAARKGKPSLTGAEIELMNLSGPLTGLEMMTPLAKDMPTTNFFERQAYARNTIVRGKTAAELLLALDQRMEENIKNAGAVEFQAVFDEVAAGQQAQR